MIEAKDIKNLLKAGEGIHLETKACKDKLPKDIWATYSAFANTRGGVILLGVTEHKEQPLNERFEFTGVTDYYKREFGIRIANSATLQSGMNYRAPSHWSPDFFNRCSLLPEDELPV